jgi:hypothetical protein
LAFGWRRARARRGFVDEAKSPHDPLAAVGQPAEQLFGFLQKAFLRKGFAGTSLEIALQAASARFVPHRYMTYVAETERFELSIGL